MTESPPITHSTQLDRQICDYLRYEAMPLAVYRELVAHLRQVDAVNAGLLPAEATTFDYSTSQIGGLWLRYTDNVTEADRDRVRSILDYYTQRFGSYTGYCPSGPALASVERDQHST